ncbi:MAG: TIGR00374 family protein, partial [Betaproteobacteria bacterium]|nr:TIGR00374 family protein [Betaproteobacteria bacterium]
MIDELVIVGVGLIGGSMARAARQHGLAKRIVGVDQRAAAVILDMGLVDESFESLKAYGKARHHDKGDQQAQRVLVMAVPPTACAALLADVIDDFGSHFWTAVTDVSSTKHAVVDAIDALRRTIAAGEDHQAQKRLAHLLGSYVSSHPMAGSELNGPSASRADLFVGARVFVSDWPETHESATALIEGLWLDRAMLTKVIVYATANWLIDAASLWVFMRAFGESLSPVTLIVSFGLANVLSVIPITPGGLGIVEGVYIPTIVGFGLDRSTATVGILTYRIAQFWLPIVIVSAV